MSQVNAITIYAEDLKVANINASNTTVITVVANQISISTGNITANSTVLKLDNTSEPIYNTSINTTAISTSSIEINGVEYTTMAPTGPLSDYQVFTNPAVASYWYKPSWADANDVVTIMMWGGGGGGSKSGPAGGGGGACVIVNKLAGECNSVCNVVVGAAGVGVISGAAGAGGNSIFWANSTYSITAYGGGGGEGSFGGGGGGWFGPGTTGGISGGPLGGNSTSTSSTFGGGWGASSGIGGNTVYGGGGSTKGANGGSSIYGGGGGAGSTQVGGTSVFGGNGANSTVAAGIPGGGGNGETGATQNGARGEVRIITTKAAIGGDSSVKYSFTANRTAVKIGDSVTYTVSTQNVPAGTSLYYTLGTSSTANSLDFTTAVNSSITINSGGANTFTLTTNADADVIDESFYMDLRTGSSTGPIVANTPSTIIPYHAFNNSYDTTDNLTTYTFSGVALGTAKSSRIVVITVTAEDGGNGTAINSATINGVAATVAIEQAQGGAASAYVGIIYAVVPTGTSGDVVITFNTGKNRVAIGVWTLYGYSTIPAQTVSSGWSGTTTRTVDVSVSYPGIAIAVATSRQSTTMTVTNATERYDLATEVTMTSTGADTTSSSSITFTAGTSGDMCALAAVWNA